MEHIKTSDFNEKVENYNGTVLVDFYADWCGPCKMLSPIVEEFAAEHPEIKVYKVNVDEENKLAIKFRVMSIPTLIVFKDGKVVKQSVGMISKAELTELFN